MDPLDLAEALLFVSLVSLLVSLVACVLAHKLSHDTDKPTTEEEHRHEGSRCQAPQ